LPRIVISGYYGFGNLGDELILSALLRELKKLSPGSDVVVLSHDPERTQREHKVRAVSRWNLFAVARALVGADLLISGGGGLLQDKSGIQTPLYYLGVILIAKLLGKPVVAWGQGMGPLQHGLNQFLCRRILGLASLIMVRDQASLDLLRQLGLPPEKLVLGADLVLGLSQSSSLKKKGPDKAGILVILRRGMSPEEESALCDFLGHAHSLTRLPLVFLSFQDEQDFEFIQRVRSNLPFETFLSLPRLELEVLLPLFSGSKLVLSMRYHALILAALAGTPALGLSSSPKIDAFLHGFGQISLAPDGLLARDEALGQFREVWKKRAVFQKSLKKGVRQSHARLKAAEAKLKELLGPVFQH